MRGLAGFVMQGRLRAALVAAAFAVISLIFAPAIIFSGAAVALVTLRRGSAEGLIVAVAGAVGSAALAAVAMGSPLAVFGVVVFWLPLLVLSMVLRNTVSLSFTTQVLGAMLLAGVLVLFLAFGDPAIWWASVLEVILSPVLAQSGIPTEQAAMLIEMSAPVMTGMVAGNIGLTLLLSLFLARYWQAVLYNPGGFGDEFRGLRLARAVSVLVVALGAFAWTSEAQLVVNMLIAVIALLVVFGLAVVHGVVHRAKASRGWLLGTYALCIVLFPKSLSAVCLLGLVDSWVDIRGRVPAA